jgi:hypothetical protein
VTICVNVAGAIVDLVNVAGALVDLATIDTLVPRDDLAAFEDALASIALAAFDAQQGETLQELTSSGETEIPADDTQRPVKQSCGTYGEY